MRILVTGATGFIGNHLVKALLSQDHRVRVVIRPKKARLYNPVWLTDSDVEVISGDITDPDAIRKATRGIDVVFHLAALLGNRTNQEAKFSYVNVYGTEVVINMSHEANVRQLIYLSTTGVMGRLKNLPGTLNDPYNPGDAYEKSKSQAEQLVLKSATQGKVNATIIRPTHVYGPGECNTLPLYRLMKRIKIMALPNGGKSCFQPIYVSDLVDALISCVEEEKSKNKVYIVAGNETISFKEFLTLSAKVIGIDVKILGLPEKLLDAIGVTNERFSDMTRFPRIVTHSRIEFFQRNHIYDAKLIRDDLGWFPKVNLEEGLKKAVNWYQQNGLL